MTHRRRAPRKPLPTERTPEAAARLESEIRANGRTRFFRMRLAARGPYRPAKVGFGSPEERVAAGVEHQPDRLVAVVDDFPPTDCPSVVRLVLMCGVEMDGPTYHALRRANEPPLSKGLRAAAARGSRSGVGYSRGSLGIPCN